MKTGFFRFQPVLIMIFALTSLCYPALSRAENGGDLIQLFHPFPMHVNGAISDDPAIASVSSQIFVSLLEVGSGRDFLPYLASSWEVSEDGRTRTFHLQAGTVFHDGQPVTSGDVAFSYRTFRKYHPLGEQMLSRVESVTTPDPGTFVMHLSQPDPALLFALASPFMPILLRHVYEEDDIFGNPANFKAVGSGPFRVAEFHPGEGFTLERFDRFLRVGRPCLDRIIGRNGASPEAVEKAFREGRAHLATFLEDQEMIRRLPEINDLKVIVTGYESLGALNYLEFNLRKKPLQNLMVRQAITHAIDLERISVTLYQGYALAQVGPLPYNSRFYNHNLPLPDPDLEKANQLLDAAGFPRGEDKVRFTTRLTWKPDAAGLQKQLAAEIQTQLDRVGIRVELDPPPNEIEWVIQVSKWEHHMTLSRVFEWGDPLLTLHPLFSSKNVRHRIGANTAGFYSDQADVLLEAASIESEPGVRAGLYQQFQEVIVEELPLFFMHETPFVTAVNRRLQNFATSGRGVIGPLDQVCWSEIRETGVSGAGLWDSKMENTP
ncbi:MAG: ABC transporter substrate-binding protein [bacterium]